MSEINYAFKVGPGSKVKLKDYDTNYSAGLSKEDAASHFTAYSAELAEMQDLLYAAADSSVLIVFQGMDTSGKDGTIRHVMSSINPQGCRVSSFKAPTLEELNHDFLWRIHAVAPGLGMLGIFNRSHYEDVLVVPVHSYKPEAVWKNYYAQINAFEKLLADSNTIVMKFFLHISKKEQLERLEAREDDPTKRWKLAVGDYLERQYWDEYQHFYEEALSKCSTAPAPWWIVPADRKWYRNLAVAETLVEHLRPYKPRWRKMLEERGDKALALLNEARVAGKVPHS